MSDGAKGPCEVGVGPAASMLGLPPAPRGRTWAAGRQAFQESRMSESNRPLPVLVAGGGIGGLAAALALVR
ncbi:MAG: hypothetical protein KDF63_05780, partial [Rhodoferax sp.]|nr:hypothetical protein [Rhodoferax sp.]